ncbi:MAG TPA: sugar phosphate isomerase/epimerase [Clostridia bacterium]|jgi:sugar phosphate isomerase/epimerase|nr:sugar phosphate isomerase/epimerase [Clostridia bacterium]
MGKIKIGTQLFSLRRYLQEEENVPQVFAKVKEMGAEVVQVSGMCAIDSKKLGEISKQYELPICITHSPVDRIKNDLDKLAEEHLDYDCKNIGIGMMPSEYRANEDGLKSFIELLNETSTKLAKYDMTIAYHNHHFEFNKYGDRIIYDIMIENTDKAVQFIPDTYWIKVGGYVPQDYIKKLTGRINTLHLKDYKKTLGVPLFRAVGKGDIDFVDILKVAEEAGVENAVVELDFSLKPYKSMEYSLNYLKKIYP